MQKDKKDSKKNIVNVDKSSGSLAYNRLDLQISQTLHMVIEFFDSLDYLLVLDYYDDITLFDNDENPEFVSYYQVKTNEESISISTALTEGWIAKLYAQLTNTEWLVKELALVTNCPLKIVVRKNDGDKSTQKKELYVAERTSFSQFNADTITKIKKDIAEKRGIKVEDVDLSKFVHMRTTLSITNHRELVEKEMGDFLLNKYPKITLDSVKAIYATMMDLLTKRQQYELLPDDASHQTVKKYKGVSKNDFARVINEAMIISIPQFSEIMDILKLGDEEKYKASFEYTKILADSQMKEASFISVFNDVRNRIELQEIDDETAWEYANKLCDSLHAEKPATKLIYNRMYICILTVCILINEMRKS